MLPHVTMKLEPSCTVAPDLRHHVASENSHIASQNIKQQTPLILNLNPRPHARVLHTVSHTEGCDSVTEPVASLGTDLENYVSCAPVFPGTLTF